MRLPLKRATREYFESRQLSTEQLKELEMLASGADAGMGDSPPKKFWRAGWLGIGVAACLVVVSGLLLSRHAPQAPMVERIAMEVALNHLNLKPLDVASSNFSEIRSRLTGLDFRLFDSAIGFREKSELLGGRYCSIQSIPAAQLRFKVSDGALTESLYQTEYRPEVFGDIASVDKAQSPEVVVVKGIRVEIWVEKGLLFALTQSNPDIRSSAP